MKRVLVVGGAGFIGSHLCARLVAEGSEVLCVDNFYTGRKVNLAPLRNEPRFELLRHDMVNPLMAEVDEIYNLACPASPTHYQTNPIKTIKTNVLGTLNALGLAKRVGARLFQASTSEVYGEPTVHPQVESYRGSVDPTGPRACYDEGKRVAETLCFDYHRQCGVQIRVARIFNTYGPNMMADDGRVVSNFIVQALRGEPLTLHGDGQQTRSFCYVDDLVEGMVRFMAHPSCTGPMNLGNPEEVTIAELAARVQTATGQPVGTRHLPLPAHDPTRRQPDIEMARAMLGWQPRVNLETGLKRTVEYFREAFE